jgi:hypothetical protein
MFPLVLLGSTHSRSPSAHLYCFLAIVGGIAFRPSYTFAQSTSGSEATPGDSASTNGYVQPMGEQPDFGKKYRPGVPSHELVLEINPLLLYNRSFAVEMEKKWTESITFGGDIIYRDANVFEKDAVKGNVQFLGVAPKIRIYPYTALAGVFFGAKLTLGQTNLSIKSSEETTEKGVLTLAPTAHVGYRFATFSGFTLAAYVGGGLNIPKPELAKSDLKEKNRDSETWNDARDDVNNATGLFRPDIGLTLGVAL